MTSPRKVLSRWPDCPDPRTLERNFSVIVREDGLSHLRKHMLPEKSEPWSSWIPLSVVQHFVTQQSVKSLQPDVRDQFLDLLRSDISNACSAPRALCYFMQKIEDGKQRWPQRWVLILPSGAICVLERQPAPSTDHSVVNCYFLNAVLNARNAAEAAASATETIARRYCLNQPTIMRPITDEVVVMNGDQPTEKHSGFEFFQAEQWGFDASGEWSAANVPNFGRAEDSFPTRSSRGVRRDRS